MDKRVAALLDELDNSTSVEPVAIRRRIVDMFDTVTEETDRVALLATLDNVMRRAIRWQEPEELDSEPLRNALLADKRHFVLREAMGPDELAHPDELLRILEREIADGRMERDSFYQLAADGAKVLSSPPPRPKKPGLLRRIFG